MKTFRRYLFSYLITLLLPVVLLSAFILQSIMVGQRSLISQQGESAMAQLKASVGIQIEQLDSFALLTASQTEFFVSHLRKPGEFYNVRSTLRKWTMTNSFARSIYFYNTAVDLVYAYDATYSRDDFFTYRLRGSGLTREQLAQMLSAGERAPCWVSAQAETEAGALFYVASSRGSEGSRNVLLFEIDSETLSELIANSALYPECTTVLCSPEGDVLYSGHLLEQGDRRELMRLCENDTSDAGEFVTENAVFHGAASSVTSLLYPQRGLRFLHFSPETVLYASMWRLRRLFVLELLAILGLGMVYISLCMRKTYKPISEIETELLRREVLPEKSDDALENVRNALLLMHRSRQDMSDRALALNKETLVLRLLLGLYASVDDFNAEGEELSLRLSGEAWRLLYLRILEAVDDESIGTVVPQALRDLFGMAPSPLYMELPESRAFIVVLCDGGSVQEETICAHLEGYGVSAQAHLSARCQYPAQFADCYARLLRGHAGEDVHPAQAYPQELLEALKNACAFGERERVLFVLDSLCELVPCIGTPAVALSAVMDALYTLERYVPQADAQALQRLKMLVFSRLPADAPVGDDVLRGAIRLLGESLEAKPSQRSEAIAGIEEYVLAHYADVDFTVQLVAEHFGYSVSNLSHYFKKYMGQPISEYVLYLRMARAQELLAGTEQTVADIAAAVGYSQTATFMRAFKKATGLSPTTYRQTNV